MPTHVHTIALKGVAGLLILFFSLATIFYVIAFASVGWTVRDTTAGDYRSGLWTSCMCSDVSADSTINAARAMITIGLCGLLVSFILIVVYLLLDFVNKSATLTAFTVTIFVSVLFMVIGFIIWGVEFKDNVGYSFILSVIGGVFTLVTGIVSVVQMRNASIF